MKATVPSTTWAGPGCSWPRRILGTRESESMPSKDQIEFRPVQPDRTFELVCIQIRDKLVRGELKPGDRLPAERTLAKQFGISRTAMREALRSLEVTGLVTLAKGVKGGPIINAGKPEVLTNFLQDLVSLNALSLIEILEVRQILLEHSARKAAAQISAEDIERIEKLIADVETAIEASDSERRLEIAFEIYRILAAATGNRALVYHVVSQSMLLRTYSDFTNWALDPELVMISRRQLLASLKNRDGEGAAAAISMLQAPLIEQYRSVSR